MRHILMEERHHYHQITGRSRTDHQRADKTLLRTQIEEGIPLMSQAIRLDRIADLVGNIGLQLAFLNVEHLIKHAWDMET